MDSYHSKLAYINIIFSLSKKANKMIFQYLQFEIDFEMLKFLFNRSDMGNW